VHGVAGARINDLQAAARLGAADAQAIVPRPPANIRPQKFGAGVNSWRVGLGSTRSTLPGTMQGSSSWPAGAH
jgi:hypothetical protein